MISALSPSTWAHGKQPVGVDGHQSHPSNRPTLNPRGGGRGGLHQLLWGGGDIETPGQSPHPQRNTESPPEKPGGGPQPEFEKQ